jgi:hypothetical protein
MLRPSLNVSPDPDAVIALTRLASLAAALVASASLPASKFAHPLIVERLGVLVLDWQGGISSPPWQLPRHVLCA